MKLIGLLFSAIDCTNKVYAILVGLLLQVIFIFCVWIGYELYKIKEKYLLGDKKIISTVFEAYYRDLIAKFLSGKTEVKLKDGTRADIEIDDFVIEVDFAKKFYEAIGQAVHYARLTGKRPMVFLICQYKSDEIYVQRAIATARQTSVEINGTEHKVVVLVYRK